MKVSEKKREQIFWNGLIRFAGHEKGEPGGLNVELVPSGGNNGQNHKKLAHFKYISRKQSWKYNPTLSLTCNYLLIKKFLKITAPMFPCSHTPNYKDMGSGILSLPKHTGNSIRIKHKGKRTHYVKVKNYMFECSKDD